MIFIGADHGGWQLKEEIKDWLKTKKIKVKDMGAKIINQEDDFPDFAVPLAKQVVKGKSNLGILICRSGIGMSMAANKIKGVRAGLCSFVGQAITARAHNNCNILVLPADFIDQEMAIKILDIFLKSEFSNEERYIKRLKKIEEVEK